MKEKVHKNQNNWYQNNWVLISPTTQIWATQISENSNSNNFNFGNLKLGKFKFRQLKSINVMFSGLSVLFQFCRVFPNQDYILCLRLITPIYSLIARYFFFNLLLTVVQLFEFVLSKFQLSEIELPYLNFPNLSLRIIDCPNLNCRNLNDYIKTLIDNIRVTWSQAQGKLNHPPNLTKNEQSVSSHRVLSFQFLRRGPLKIKRFYCASFYSKQINVLLNY